MPLTDDDIDRIGDKTELRFRKVMDEHLDKIHGPVEVRLKRVESNVIFSKGAMWILGILFTAITAIGGAVAAGMIR